MSIWNILQEEVVTVMAGMAYEETYDDAYTQPVVEVMDGRSIAFQLSIEDARELAARLIAVADEMEEGGDE